MSGPRDVLHRKEECEHDVAQSLLLGSCKTPGSQLPAVSLYLQAPLGSRRVGRQRKKVPAREAGHAVSRVWLYEDFEGCEIVFVLQA